MKNQTKTKVGRVWDAAIIAYALPTIPIRMLSGETWEDLFLTYLACIMAGWAAINLIDSYKKGDRE